MENFSRIENPVYNKNYKPGYIGFTYKDNSFISDGILFFTDKQKYFIKVSHVFLVESKLLGIEANWGGINRFNLNKYFKDSHTHVFFCKPRDFNSQKAEIILNKARLYIGKKYDYKLFLGFILRKIISPLEKIKWLRSKPSLFDSEQLFICSELVSVCLKEIQKYKQYWPLFEYHTSKINPQMLFHSPIWEKWFFLN